MHQNSSATDPVCRTAISMSLSWTIDKIKWPTNLFRQCGTYTSCRHRSAAFTPHLYTQLAPRSVECASKVARAYGVRRQSAAATALWAARDRWFWRTTGRDLRQSGVALRLPPHSIMSGTSRTSQSRTDSCELRIRMRRSRRFNLGTPGGRRRFRRSSLACA
jgi:hypothetical protein